MSIDQIDKIDFIGINRTDQVELTISDHLEWDSENEHLLLLQTKINAYLDFIFSGQILDDYPNAKDKDIVISVVMKYFPNEDGLEFLNRTYRTLLDAKIEFEWRNLIQP